jgi:diaminohydroxyphosphoribosylaminopyrimidine deaminase/5-amino-6-(5-phosphoribosylamino)uracil reductase
MSAFSDRDRELMRRALELAARGMFTTTPNPRVGCVIAREGRVIGEGWHERAGEAHAEARALADTAARDEDARGATAYVTLEPCNHYGRTPPCTAALLDAGIARVVVAMRDPSAAAGHGADRLLYREARRLGAPRVKVAWAQRRLDKTPTRRRTLGAGEIAASIDGRTALAGGESQWITGPEARADGHRWRARSCAILTGIGTVLQDDPQLTVRAVETTRQPMKVVVDRHGDLPPKARVLAGAPVVIFSAETPRVSWPRDVESVVLRGADGRVDLPAMLKRLGERGINELHEAGAKLNGALLAAGLVDELLLYLAPCLLGDPARGMFELPAPMAKLSDRFALRIASMERIGEDWRILARPHRPEA